LTKTLTIRHEVYDKLTAVKGKEESFSELLDRLVDGAGLLESLKKLRGSVEFVDKKKMLREIEASRAERSI
jgi:predicted CopG family antitoxin